MNSSAAGQRAAQERAGRAPGRERRPTGRRPPVRPGTRGGANGGSTANVNAPAPRAGMAGEYHTRIMSSRAARGVCTVYSPTARVGRPPGTRDGDAHSEGVALDSIAVQGTAIVPGPRTSIATRARDCDHTSESKSTRPSSKGGFPYRREQRRSLTLVQRLLAHYERTWRDWKRPAITPWIAFSIFLDRTDTERTRPA